jgi:hypothetical protein
MALTASCRIAALAAIVTLVGRPAAAQEAGPPQGRPWFVGVSKVVKWPTLAAAIGFTAAAIVRKDNADEVYDRLQALCLEGSDNCRSGADGTYLNPEAESLYQETMRLDGHARRWMIGGQGFLVVSAGMFLIDLISGSSKPENIPFTPLEAWASPGRVGLRWRF